MTPLLTADTITDAQIRSLRDLADRSVFFDIGIDLAGGPEIVELCDAALDRSPGTRARCAEILNARTGKAMAS